MGHDGGFFWSKFVTGDEHNWLAEVKGGNEKIDVDHCGFKLMMDKRLMIKCFIEDNGRVQNPLPDGCEQG